jgi:putative transposase
MEENNLGLPKDFFKQFKDKEQFQEFFQEMFKQGVNEMLQGELDSHLGYEKHASEGRNSGNSRNGSSSKRVKAWGMWFYPFLGTEIPALSQK